MSNINKKNVTNLVAISCITNQVIGNLSSKKENSNIDGEKMTRVVVSKVIDTVDKHNQQ